MGYVFFAAMLFTIQARADFFIIQNEKIYSVVSKYSPENTSVEKAHFLKIGVKQDSKNGTTSYKAEGVTSAGAFTLQKVPSAPKVTAGEGCAENPMAWLKSSKVLGQLKKRDPAMYVQVASKVTAFGKTPVGCPAGNRFSDGPAEFSGGDKDLAVLICSGDLNYNLLVMKANSVEADLVITDNCP
ncbi:hypothetical protein BH10BDE1_BH10BDE1_33350 [soil metagenome]